MQCLFVCVSVAGWTMNSGFLKKNFKQKLIWAAADTRAGGVSQKLIWAAADTGAGGVSQKLIWAGGKIGAGGVNQKLIWAGGDGQTCV